MTHFWVYAEGGDEAGCVVDAETPEDALTKAMRLGFAPADCPVWAYELKELHYLGVQP